MDGAAPPAELIEALRIDGWGDPYGGGWKSWPAGLALQTVVCLNLYNALKSYRDTKNRGKWTRENPKLWAIVAGALKLQREAKQQKKAQK